MTRRLDSWSPLHEPLIRWGEQLDPEHYPHYGYNHEACSGPFGRCAICGGTVCGEG
jgi:hypothetical protein